MLNDGFLSKIATGRLCIDRELFCIDESGHLIDEGWDHRQFLTPGSLLWRSLIQVNNYYNINLLNTWI
jgi:hypothetical protein